VLVFPYVNEMNNLEGDTALNLEIVTSLKEEDPTISNLLIDYSELHKRSKQTKF